MKKLRRRVLAAVFILHPSAFILSFADEPAIVDFAGALGRVAAAGTPLTLTLGAERVPPGGHLQGIQMRFEAAGNRHVAFLSHDSLSVAYLVVAEFPADFGGDGRVFHILEFPGDGRSPPLRHAGGIQILGDVLVVGLEDNRLKTRSEIQFWNVSTPAQPAQLKHLTIHREGTPKDKTAGAVGLVQRDSDHLLAVANWDSRAVDFYLSNDKPLDDPRCRFAFQSRWLAGAGFSAYQAVNLARDANQKIFLIGFSTTPSGADVVDLFSVDVRQQPEALLRKLASKPLQLAAENHFQYSGGIWIRDGKLALLSSPRDLGRQTQINIAAEGVAP